MNAEWNVIECVVNLSFFFYCLFTNFPSLHALLASENCFGRFTCFLLIGIRLTRAKYGRQSEFDERRQIAKYVVQIKTIVCWVLITSNKRKKKCHGFVRYQQTTMIHAKYIIMSRKSDAATAITAMSVYHQVNSLLEFIACEFGFNVFVLFHFIVQRIFSTTHNVRHKYTLLSINSSSPIPGRSILRMCVNRWF